MKLYATRASSLIRELSNIGIALSKEKDHTRLMEMILQKAMDLTFADGGTLYRCTPDKKLKFEILMTKSLGIHLGGTSLKEVALPPLNLFNEEGQPNTGMVATWAVISRKTANIKDVYKEKKFDFSGTKAMDKEKKYHSQSFLTVPMVNHLDEVIGVLQLINAIEPTRNKIRPFSALEQELVESLASQAAMVITQKTLINAQKELFDSLIKLIASSIDEKSAYTGEHCRNVPVLTHMISEALCNTKEGPYKNFSFTDDEKYELDVAAWLHDCGKIITPEYVVDKATKLQSVFDRIELIDTRFEVLKREMEIDFLRNGKSTEHRLEKSLEERFEELDRLRNFLHQFNIGGEQMNADQHAMIDDISQLEWTGPDNEKHPFLSEDEVNMLKIHRGTLSTNERQTIQNHVVLTAKMLHSLPYPENLKNVPQYASYHHEKIDGSGYPKGLKGDEIPIQARIIAIADIFEALTASARPYKKALPMEQVLSIIKNMAKNGELDQDLLNIFLENKIHEKYAKRYLDDKH